MDYSILNRWLEVAQLLDSENQRMFLLNMVTYAATGEEIPVNDLVKIACAPLKIDLDKEKERKRIISQKRSEASLQRKVKRGGNSK